MSSELENLRKSMERFQAQQYRKGQKFEEKMGREKARQKEKKVAAKLAKKRGGTYKCNRCYKYACICHICSTCRADYTNCCKY